MKYRIHFEPVDIEGKDWTDVRHQLTRLQNAGMHIAVNKIISIDKDGFPIEQPKQVE